MSFMKKLIACCLLLFLIVGGGCLSYSISKKHAEAVRDDYQRDYHLSISPLKGHLMLGIDGKLSPFWFFNGEYLDAITGCTFDVYVSLFGKIFKTPPIPPRNQND